MRSLLNVAYAALVEHLDHDDRQAFAEAIGMVRAPAAAERHRAPFDRPAPRMRTGAEVKPGESPWRVDPRQQAAAMQALMGAAQMPSAGVTV